MLNFKTALNQALANNDKVAAQAACIAQGQALKERYGSLADAPTAYKLELQQALKLVTTTFSQGKS